jgi:hypothetical protein
MNSREEIIQMLVDDYGKKASSFNNTPTNKQREKFWTYNRLKNYLISLEAERLLGTFEQMEELDFGAKDIGYQI